MRYRYLGGALFAAAAMLVGPSTARAQYTDGADGGFQTPLNASPNIPLPTGHSGDAGFYTGIEFVMLNQTRAIGSQTIARRGFYDITGQVTGVPGRLVGDGTQAINPGDFSRRTFQPGGTIEVGYRLKDGTQIYMRYLQLVNASYSQGASLVPPGFATRLDLANTFLSSPVVNFNSQFAGPTGKVQGVPDGAVYGIWNAASQMDIKFSQRFQNWEAGMRTPLFQTDYSRVYGTAGLQFSWFFERFQWRTVSFDLNGNTSPINAADYTNTLSQRMYGPFLGCGHEVFVANQFSVSLDLSGALLLAVEKQRAKYKLGDNSIQSKWGREEFRLVPNANASVNLWWYPVEGVQLRVGYQALSYFNTLYMRDPVGFDFGNIQPGYATKYFRLVHGFNVGIGFFF